MRTRQNFSGSLVNPAGIAVLFVLVLIANYFQSYVVSSFLLFICFLFAVSFLWGRFALNRVKVQIRAENQSVFPGQRFPVSFSVTNDKMLPLIWIETLLQMPENSCVKPDETFDTNLYEDKKDQAPYLLSRRKFTWIMWHQQLQWQTHFEAVRRGVFFLQNISLSSGDGFGLTIREKLCRLTSPPAFVVYPRLIEVDAAPFLRNMHNAASGSRGYYEDVTLLKSNRDYQTGDSFKKINWRLLARQDQMQVNIYETILPRASFFILDAGSFQKRQIDPVTEKEVISSHETEFEDMLSLMGSLFLALKDQEMGCGLALPDVGEKKGELIPPALGDLQVNLLLSALAGIQYAGEPTFMNETEILSGRENWGQMYLCVRSLESCTCKRLLDNLDGACLTVITTRKEDEAVDTVHRKLWTQRLKGDEGA